MTEVLQIMASRSRDSQKLTPSPFPTTNWTVIQNFGHQKQVLSELYQKYWQPLCSYLRYRGYNQEIAQDLVQGFFADKVLGQELVGKSDRSRGKFRNFLLTSLKHYIIDVNRRLKPSVDFELEPEESSRAKDAEAQFLRSWAEQLLQEVLDELRDEYFRNNKGTHWELFRTWLVESDLDQANIHMKDLCTRLNIPSSEKAYNMIASVKGRFRIIMRRRLHTQSGSQTDIDDEIRSYINLFS
jgi:hypothetical protein